MCDTSKQLLPSRLPSIPVIPAVHVDESTAQRTSTNFSSAPPSRPRPSGGGRTDPPRGVTTQGQSPPSTLPSAGTAGPTPAGSIPHPDARASQGTPSSSTSPSSGAAGATPAGLLLQPAAPAPPGPTPSARRPSPTTSTGWGIRPGPVPSCLSKFHFGAACPATTPLPHFPPPTKAVGGGPPGTPDAVGRQVQGALVSANR